MGEVKGLQKVLGNKKDIKPNVGNWQWKADSPWPPVNLITKTRFWDDKVYEEIRSRLGKAAPEINLIPGGAYASCHLGKQSQQEEEHDVEGELIWEGEGPKPADWGKVCNACYSCLPIVTVHCFFLLVL